MAQLNFPDPAVTQTYTEAGITWTWNATLGVWSSDDNDGFTETDADQRYLRIDAGAPDQTRVSGEATFAELTTHEAGVSVTGGDGSVTTGIIYSSDRYLQLRAGSGDAAFLRCRCAVEFSSDHLPLTDRILIPPIVDAVPAAVNTLATGIEALGQANIQ